MIQLALSLNNVSVSWLHSELDIVLDLNSFCEHVSLYVSHGNIVMTWDQRNTMGGGEVTTGTQGICSSVSLSQGRRNEMQQVKLEVAMSWCQ